MTEQRGYRRFVHVTACIAVLVALLPITVGAAVTTLRAGMAFPDWPTSDGHNMLTYPWFKSAGDKFIEHGHRLAGVAIGLTSIVLAIVSTVYDRRWWAKAFAWGLLAAIVFQGLLGGKRVTSDQQIFAFVHGLFAAIVFVNLALYAVMTGPRWHSELPDCGGDESPYAGALFIGCGTVAMILVQYVLGGLLRHLGLCLAEHIVCAAAAGLAVVLFTGVSLLAGHPWLRLGAWHMLAAVALQLLLGVAAWATKYGYGETVLVTHGSPLQVTVRSLHTVVGMTLFATCAVQVARLARLQMLWLRQANRGPSNRPSNSESQSLMASAPAGGVA